MIAGAAVPGAAHQQAGAAGRKLDVSYSRCSRTDKGVSGLDR